jgi:manganese-dependent inorganic pyrophosphatase
MPVGVNTDNIVCIIDHHQLLGNAIQINEPRMVDIQPWGSTTTILAFKYVHAKKIISRPIAGCLLSGVLSDTV